ncbi:unnamed protein product [Paramecium sonneborni]|uniref:Transmembrane protein n=1 Tax=Paramecium sonneborni TaxID=65129 RepID=A0A8S1Q177_9CILI|nr:unnamed protein product [Paramecium sonneborni]
MISSQKCYKERIQYLQLLILILIELIYTFTFQNCYYQIPDLYSKNGLPNISNIKILKTKMPTLLQLSKMILLGPLLFASQKFIK